MALGWAPGVPISKNAIALAWHTKDTLNCLRCLPSHDEVRS